MEHLYLYVKTKLSEIMEMLMWILSYCPISVVAYRDNGAHRAYEAYVSCVMWNLKFVTF